MEFHVFSITPSAGQQQVHPLLEAGYDSSSANDHRTDPHSATPLLSSAAQELRTATLMPSSAAQARTHGALAHNNQIPSIQVNIRMERGG